MGVAAYNTFAQVKNMYDAVSGIPDAFGKITSFLGDGDWDDDPKSALFMKVILPLVLLALFSGLVLTYVIVQKYAGTLRAPKANEYQVKYD
jgi:ABC-type molybdate transport system permease subunit